MEFPFGKAPLCILALALVMGVVLAVAQTPGGGRPPDLVFAISSRNHYDAYIHAIPEFEKERGVKVQTQLINARALQSRLRSALMVGADVPDLVELLNGSMGFFAKGPLEDVGFADLTDTIRAEGLDKAMVESRFSLWESRGHVFALPHDVHPVALAYRRDLIEALGIDANALETWDDFVAMGRKMTADLNRDGIYDRYALDLPTNGGYGLQVLILQRGGEYFTADGAVAFDSDLVADTICWYLDKVYGPNPIATSGGSGQALYKAIQDGLILFHFCPDWRTKTFETDMPSLAGKMALMPLPAWEKGGRRTSTWGGTGLAIAKRCKDFDLAWDFARFLYLRKDIVGKRFASLNILPPLKEAWTMPEIRAPRPYYSNQPIGELFAALGPQTPPDYVSAFTILARAKVDEAMANAVVYYKAHGEAGLREYVKKDLRRCADYVRTIIARNRFLEEGLAETGAGPDEEQEGAP